MNEWLWEVEAGDAERRRGAVSVTMATAQDLRFPARCPVCAKPPSVIVEVLYEASYRGNLRRLAVPFCAPCAARVRARFRRVAAGVLVALVVFFAAVAVSGALGGSLAMAPVPSPFALQAVRLAPAALVPVALRWVWLAFRKRWFIGVRIVGADPAGTRLDLVIDDREYAEALLALTPSAHAGSTSPPR